MVAPFFRYFSRLKLFEMFLGSESCGMSSTMYCLLLEVVIELLWTQHVAAARLESRARTQILGARSVPQM
jgi:hypothetical protein